MLDCYIDNHLPRLKHHILAGSFCSIPALQPVLQQLVATLPNLAYGIDTVNQCGDCLIKSDT
jgi:hypothetical protein